MSLVEKYTENIKFEADSSPQAWEHYQKVYVKRNSKIVRKYDFNKLFFYNYYKDVGLDCGFKIGDKWFNYINLPKSKGKNRLFALKRNVKIFSKEIRSKEVEYCEPSNRLGGECDFNFNNKKYFLFKEIILNDNNVTDEQKNKAILQLEKCKGMHHEYWNFSLMESMGNMQGFKGNNRFDRFDTFLYELNNYFLGVSNNLLSNATDDNKEYLISFLGMFANIYEYCKEIYFIDDNLFVERIVYEGMLPINTCDDVIRYMNLAEEFWRKKKETLSS